MATTSSAVTLPASEPARLEGARLMGVRPLPGGLISL
jgi:hypothetical protein